MSRVRKQKYSPDFKRNIAEEVSLSRSSAANKAKELGVNESTIRRWVKEFSSERVDPVDDKNESLDGYREYGEQLLLSCYRAFDRCKDAIAIISKDKHFYCNSAYLELFGYAGLEDLKNRPFADLVNEDSRSHLNSHIERTSEAPGGPCVEIEFRCVRSDGENLTAKVELSRFPGEGGLVQLVITQPEGVHPHGAFASMVKRDYLTGMYSRQAFLDELRTLISENGGSKAKTALMLIDIDKFEDIQKELGYEKSDEVIRNVAEYLEKELAGARINARFDCHLFSSLIVSDENVSPVKMAENICKDVSNRLIQLDGQSMMLTCSIGLYWFDKPSVTDVEYLISRAAYACNLANGAGGNAVHVYDPMEDMLSTEQQKVWTERILAALKSANNFSMVYQPIVNLHGNSSENYEAFIRMNNKNGTEYLPGSFIPAAEHAGLMRVVDRWVIRHAVRVLEDESQKGKNLNIFINLSRDILVDESFIGWLKERINEKKIQPSSLVFELEESDVVTHIAQSSALIDGMRTLGCRTVLDHFGSGLNSFSLLDKINVDFLKIDGSLIHDLARNKTSQVAVKSITEMAQSRGKTTIAGFVQDASSLAILWQCGVSYIQGYFLQEPSRSMGYNFAESDFI